MFAVTYPSTSLAQSTNIESIKTISLRVVKTVNGWARVLDTGHQILLSAREARDLGLSPTAAVGHVVTVVALDTYEDAKLLATDFGNASRYVAVDVAVPALGSAYVYSQGVIIPKSKELISDGATFTTEVAVPRAREFAENARDAAAPVIVDVSEYATDTAAPAIRDAASSAADSAVSGVKSLFGWASK